MADIEHIRQTVSLVETVKSHGVALRAEAGEFIGCCPFHAERSPSFTLYPGRDGIWRFHCFGCGVSGDVIDFIGRMRSVGTPESLQILGGQTLSPQPRAPETAPPHNPYAHIERLTPIMELAPDRNVVLYNPKRERNGNICPTLVFPYRHRDGTLFGYVLRNDFIDPRTGEKRKETPMVCWARLPDGTEGWCRLPFPKPRLLYGLERLDQAGPVILVEGEKCADALFRTTGQPVLSWPGGVQGVAHADWSPLHGRDVIIWPDADAPGFAAAENIRTRLAGQAARIRFIDIFKGVRCERNDI